MFAQQAEITEFEATSAQPSVRGQIVGGLAGAGSAELDDFEDELAPARGFALGSALGLASLLALGGALWWAF